MVRIDRVVTRGGDGGMTSLGDGTRLRKDAPLIAAIGAVDEANAAIGWLRVAAPAADAMLARVQNDLFDVGADLCVPGEGGARLRLTEAPVLRLEAEVETMNAAIPPLTSFILPGGTEAAARAHMARTIVRRAERALIAAEGVNMALSRYLNRLSDHLFVLARVLNDNGKADVQWVPGANLGGEAEQLRALLPGGFRPSGRHPIFPGDASPRMRRRVMPVLSASRQAALVAAELIAVIVAVTDGQPRVLTIDDGVALPSGPFEGSERSLQASLRTWVERQTHHPLGYMEQLYTFADPGRTGAPDSRIVSVSYLGLTREAPVSGDPGAGWRDWYRYFPWEDRRGPVSLAFMDALLSWADGAPDLGERRRRHHRVAINFGLDKERWNEELILQRYENLWEAGLVPEAGAASLLPGIPMAHDHRRILATGIARLRAKIKYRPVVFELMPPDFTLLRLQRTVEALAGSLLHKQNFRRLIDQQDLVEETGDMAAETRGRPAKLFRFRREVVTERAVAGSKLPLARSA